LSNSGSDDSFVRPSVRITRIVFSSGQSLELNENDKVLLIGPNNAGKSKFLSEIAAYIESHADQRGVVVHEVHLDKKGRQSDLRQYLETAGEVFSNAYRLGNWEIGSNVIRHWDDTNHLPYGLAKGFFKLIKADDRLKICEQQQSVAPDDQKPKPQHILYHDSVLMDRVSALFEKAFGQSLMFNYRGGNRLPIHVGKLPDTSITGVDRVSDAYVAAVRNNPLLDQQGDGVKSYAGILFESIVSDYDIVALDEPEAFLHPPQMRRLAETLAVEVKKQLIVATHSSDIVRGFLQGSDGSVRVVRIRRSGKDNSITETAPETVRELWTRPELRYSNALDALFHDEVVICEDESDCKLYNAVADHIQSEANETWPDIAYVPSGGKHGAPKIAGVLHRMGVPVKQIYDIDFLSECDLVRASVLAVDGPWEEVAPLCERLRKTVASNLKPKTAAEVAREIVDLLEKFEGDHLPRSDVNRLMKQTSSWSLLKQYGVAGLPGGDAREIYRSLVDALCSCGIHVVPVGEVENFATSLGGHGPAFVDRVLQHYDLGDPDLEELRRFVTAAIGPN
jgi:energy-coupling factor transporter ATP-binding protein EcfA2